MAKSRSRLWQGIIDEAAFRKVGTPTPAYKLGKKKSTSANWV